MIFDRARANPGALGALRLFVCGLGLALAAALTGCSTSTNISNGTPVVTVSSQAAGDFSTYVVGITLYSATRSDGYVAYPAGYTYEEFADLTQRVDLTELLNAVGLPAGNYTSVTIGLDYSSPIVYINGQSTSAAVKNATGTQNFGIVYVNVKLDPSNPLKLGTNQSSEFDMYVDLATSNSVSASTNTVVVRPFVAAIAPAAPPNSQPIRARGLFVATNSGQSSFVENVRPFEDNIYSTVGALTVATGSSTYYNINGTVYSGAAGLAAMATLTSNTPVVAFGSLTGLNGITPTLTATQVYAGTVVSNGQYEHVRGIVTARSGNTLTVSDATYLYYEGYCLSNLCFTWYPTATVTIGPNTVVTQDGIVPPSALTAQAISVGSKIDVVGLGSNNSSGALTLDATGGLVRLQSAPLWGTLGAGTASSATLGLLSIGSVPASSFNFAGTGTSSGNDATAASYAIDTSPLGTAGDLSATPAGTLLRIDGFATAYGSAPPDYTASAITAPAAQNAAYLVVEWNNGSGTTAPFTSQDSTSLVLNLANATTAEVVTGPQSAALSGAPAVTISGTTQFAIGNASSGVSMFGSSSAFIGGLGTSVNGTNNVYRVVAIGAYDPATNTFTATRVDVALD
jgi:hypothetical protein